MYSSANIQPSPSLTNIKKWEKTGDFSKLIVKSMEQSLNREVKYNDIENSQEINFLGYNTNKIMIVFTTLNINLLQKLKNKGEASHGENIFLNENEFRFITGYTTVLSWFLDIINSSPHPIDKDTMQEINEILEMQRQQKIPDPIDVLELKLRDLLKIPEVDRGKAKQKEIDETYHKFCGYGDSDLEAMIKGVTGTEYVLFSLADRIRYNRTQVSSLQNEVALLQGQLALANRTSVAVNPQSLFGNNGGLPDTKRNKL